MATFQTGDTSGGLKKTCGVVISPNISKTWIRVRNDLDTSVNWMLIGYLSKTVVDVVATGSGSLRDGILVEIQNGKYDDQCLFGGFRDGDRFSHFTFVGSRTGAMAKGRASLHRNAILNELEGCVREENLIQNEVSPPVPDVAAVPNLVESTSGQTEDQTVPAIGIFEALSDEDFANRFKMSRREFDLLPKWKQANAKKACGMF